jgi:hypothetical protein
VQVTQPEIHGSEAQPADLLQQGVETLLEGLERAEIVLGRTVALAPAFGHVVVELPRHEVRGQ